MAASFTVKVKNNNDFPLEDRADGLVYVMPAKGSVNIPSYAATHIFGVPFLNADGQATINREQIYSHLQRRWGGNRTKREDGRNFRNLFENLEFKLVAMRLVEENVEETGDELEEAPSNAEPPPMRRRPKHKMPEENIVEQEAEGNVA